MARDQDSAPVCIVVTLVQALEGERVTDGQLKNQTRIEQSPGKWSIQWILLVYLPEGFARADNYLIFFL